LPNTQKRHLPFPPHTKNKKIIIMKLKTPKMVLREPKEEKRKPSRKIEINKFLKNYRKTKNQKQDKQQN
jgi:hypothetical protein